MKIGDAWVSTELQNLDSQEDSLNKFGRDKIFTDHMSGVKSTRPGSDYEAITSIIKITKGNFHLLHRLFAQIHRILEINELNTINIDVIEAARDSLVIGI